MQEQTNDPLRVIICWHMHQPDYRDARNGQFQLPWTYLHAIKDYVDMIAHLEKVPQARVVINFAPILLQQIDDYSQQVKQYFARNEVISDPLLNALIEPTLPTDDDHRHMLIKVCMRANEQHLISRFQPYHRLVTLGKRLHDHPEEIRYLNSQYFADLLVWYHLAWLGETVRRENPQVKELIEKGSGYSLHDRRVLLTVIGELLSALIGRYRRLMEQGQVELSMSPYAHPIVPLLMDVNCARQAMPDIAMPVMEAYPGGVERAQWQLQQGINVFQHYFARKPAGCWLSEGGLSEQAMGLLEKMGFLWCAGGENVLRNSINGETAHAAKETFLYQPYHLHGNDIACFFRDDELSDLIGFTYSDWHADDAVADFIHRLEAIAEYPVEPGAIVSIILDGENAWEHYPENGFYFLSALYQAIASHPKLAFATFSDGLKTQHRTGVLNQLLAGSWVYGTFSTWIGDEQKNRGWDMLADAKHCYDQVVASGQLTDQQKALADKQLAICESSDWFWWFGDYNPAETVSDFERLYRMHLSNLYLSLGQEPPGYLTEVFTHGSGNPLHGGVMRTATESSP